MWFAHRYRTRQERIAAKILMGCFLFIWSPWFGLAGCIVAPIGLCIALLGTANMIVFLQVPRPLNDDQDPDQGGA